MAIFRFIKMVAAAILYFRNFNFLKVGTLKRVELCHRAESRRKRSNRDRDMVIFHFPRWRSSAILDL